MSQATRFLSELNTLKGGTNKTTKRPSFTELLDKARFDFIQTGKAQIDKIKAGEGTLNKYGNLQNAWSERTAHGYKVSFKSGGKTLELLKGKTYFYVPDADTACELIAKCVIAAENHELDDKLVNKQAEKAEKPAAAFIAKVKQEWDTAELVPAFDESKAPEAGK